MMLNGENFSVNYDQSMNTVYFSGRLRSTDAEVFKGVAELLAKASALNKLAMVWDVTQLNDINSAGLGVMYHFVIAKREIPHYALKIKASAQSFWQARSLPNLKKLLPKVQLEYVA